MQTVAVFFGGASCEHEVSVLTGLLVTKLLETKVKLLPVYVSMENEFFDGSGKVAKDYESLCIKGKRVSLIRGGLKVGRRKYTVDATLNCCHGGLGEGGGLSALLEWYHIPSCSPSMTESALFQDKYLSKLAVRSLGVRTADGLRITQRQYEKDRLAVWYLIEEKLSYPVIVKPNRLGSSVGIGVAKDRVALEQAMGEAFTYDTSVLVEEFLKDKRDINCAVYEGERLVLSECEEVISSDEILSFDDKYERTRNTKLVEGELAREIKATTAKIYRRMALHGVVRLDFIVSEDKVYFNELNVVPGSLAYYLFTSSMVEAREFLLTLIRKTNESYKKVATTGLIKRGRFTGQNSCKIR